MNEQIFPTNGNLAYPIFEAKIPLGMVAGKTVQPDLNLSVHARQIVWLLGRSGIGKTTILRKMARLHEDPRVDMKYRGVLYSQIAPRNWRRSILYVNQRPILFRGSVRENIFKPFGLKLNRDKVPNLDLVVKLLRKVDLSDSFLERDALTLSVGEMARICLVRSLLMNPDVLLLDEPTASLDSESRIAVAITLKEWLSQTNSGIIGVTHDETLTEMIPGLEIHLGQS
ncbi:MAG: ATP-binding cassette domain-containing protein [Deltaproteobacteria bacterium]|nr:ATP-binding cassette domain-containing protein [Deltaproteobacteria bacterium]